MTTAARAAHARAHLHRYDSILARRLHYWRIRQAFERGAATLAQLASQHHYAVTMIRHIVRTAQQPDLFGLAEATALRASAAKVPPRVAAILLATHATDSAAEQAATLGFTIKAIYTYRRRLRLAGLLNPSAGLHARTQARTRAQRERIAHLLRSGLTRQEVAEICTVSEWYVTDVAARYGGVSALQRAAATYTLAGVAAVMGVGAEAVASWIAAGYLYAPRHAPSRGAKRPHQQATHYTIARADLCAFLRERQAWPRWGPAAITDPDLRRYAELQRAAAGGCWRTAVELGALIGLTPSCAYERARRGWLADWEQVRWGRAVFYWHPTGRVMEE
jgi:hypothetical protein